MTFKRTPTYNEIIEHCTFWNGENVFKKESLNKDTLIQLIVKYIEESKKVSDLYYIYNEHKNKLRQYNQVNLAIPLKIIYWYAVDNNILAIEELDNLLNEETKKKYGVNLVYENIIPDRRFASYELTFFEKDEYEYDSYAYGIIANKMSINVSDGIAKQLDDTIEYDLYEILCLSSQDEIMQMIGIMKEKFSNYELESELAKLPMFEKVGNNG